MDDDVAIDICRKYIDNKMCSYLAKEDQVVYFSSDTGRVSDAKWHKMTLSQTHRIIQSMHSSKAFGVDKLLTAFQEAGEVYERGVKTRHSVAEGLFNYQSKSGLDCLDEVLCSMLVLLLKHNYTCIKMTDLNRLASEVARELGMSDTGLNDKLITALESESFDPRTGSRRPRIGGHLIPCAVYRGAMPKDLRVVLPEDFASIKKILIKEYK